MSDLDTTTFNAPNGFVTTSFNTLPSPPETLPQDIAVSVVIRSDNRIIMGGYSQYTTDSYITLSCYNTDGSLYTGFGGGTGKVLQPVIPLGFTGCNVNDVILQPNDYIIVTGNTSYLDPLYSTPRPSMFVARFTDVGILDTTFNFGFGVVIISPSTFNSGGNVFDQCYSNSVIIQPSDGYIVLGGSVRLLASPNNKNFIALVRFDTTGALDTSFGTTGNGTIYASFNSSTNNEDFCNCLSIQTNGYIVSGGVNSSIPSATTQNLSVSRFNTSGLLDTTFNSLGASPGWLIIPNFFTSPNNSIDFSSGIGINSVGQIIISCYITKQPAGEQCFGVAAVTSSGLFPGTLDTSFGSVLTPGQTILDLSPSPTFTNLIGTAFSSGANALALQTDNKIVITGGFTNTITGIEGFSLARFDATGTLDTTFGVAGLGYILSDLVSPNTEIGYSVAIQTDGKILVGGTAVNAEDTGANNYFILARYFYTPITPIPIAPICFPAGTPVLTDQGYIEIDKIEPSNNTINGRPIIAVTKTISPSNKLVCFEKSSLGYNIPNRTTYVSTEHCIVYRNKLIEARKFVNRKRRVYYIKYYGKYLYNILMNGHYSMIVNNIKVETLNPRNIIAKLYTNGYNTDYKIELINRINKHYLRNAEQRVIKEGMYKNMMLNYTRAKNQRYIIHRYNQLMNYKAFFTRKRAHNIPSFPVPNVASVASVASVPNIPNVASVASVAEKELLKPIPQPPVEYKPSKPNIIKSKIKIDTIGKNKVTLKKIIGTNNKIRIFSYKYTGSKVNK